MKQTVLIVHNYYQTPGGEDTVVANEKKLLEEHGHRVVLYTRHNSELNDHPLRKKLLLPFCTIFNPRTYREIRNIIKTKKIDIVHVHNTLALVSPAVYYAARSCGVPVVQTVHNFRLLCPGATFYRDDHICEDCVRHGLSCAVRHGCYRGSKLQTLLCVLSTKLHRLTGIYSKIHYICLTEFNREKLLQGGFIKPEQIFVKPNFLDHPLPFVSGINRKAQFIFVGRLDLLKGIEVLFNAWRLLGKNAPPLLVCGTGPMDTWCQNFLKEHNLSSVTLKGFVAHSSVLEYIAESQALIMPTQWYEGFPMSIVESFSVGTPVIGSNIGNVKGLIDEGKNGWSFQFDSPESLAAVVRKALDTPIVLDEDFRQNYTGNTNYNQIEKIYRECHL